MTVKELKKELDDKKIPYLPTDNKATLESKLAEGLPAAEKIEIKNPVGGPKSIKGYDFKLKVKMYSLNDGNVKVTNEGGNGTFKLTAKLAEEIIKRGDAHLLDVIPKD